MTNAREQAPDETAPREKLREALNAADRVSRLEAAREAGRRIDSGALMRSETREVNNHVHTRYSFSPYSPARAAFEAWQAGLLTVGSMDHDSIAGAAEMIEACAEIGIASTVGFELRVNMNDTAVAGRALNNPDSKNIAYIAIHAVPANRFGAVADFLAPIQRARNERTERMVHRLNDRLESWGIAPLDFKRDVYDLSEAAEGGAITERHMLYALAQRLVEEVGRGSTMTRYLSDRLGLELPGKLRAFLEDESNRHYLYDLLGVFKSGLLGEIYIQPDYNECVNVRRAVEFARSIAAIPAYAYLGDVEESPTGDKAAAKYEDDFLDELAAEIKRIGFQAITYMPPRNSRAQIRRVQRLCAEHDLMQISGVDINSSRQSFNCPEIAAEEFSELRDAAFALVAHEKLAARGFRRSLVQEERPAAGAAQAAADSAPPASFAERVALWSRIGREMDHRHVESVVGAAERVLKEKL